MALVSASQTRSGLRAVHHRRYEAVLSSTIVVLVAAS